MIEIMKEFPKSYKGGTLTSSTDGSAVVSFHFSNTVDAELWFNNLTGEAQNAADDKAGGEVVAWVRWDDDEKYWDIRRNAPSQEAVAYLAKWNLPPWVPAYPQPQASPAGYALVPVEPTPEMIENGRWSEFAEETSRLFPVDDDAVRSVYSDMIAAAPTVK